MKHAILAAVIWLVLLGIVFIADREAARIVALITAGFAGLIALGARARI